MPKKIRRIWLIIIILLGFYYKSYGQVTLINTGQNNNPTHLVQNLLLGNGVQVFNISFQGDTGMQFGKFIDQNKSTIGVDSGLVLCTGLIHDITNNPAQNPTTAVNAQDPNLLSLANLVPQLLGLNFTVNAVNDAAIIEFDFIPNSDTIEFTYVFGSSEYPDYSTGNPVGGFVGQQFNDVFGFFISGPGITGPYQSPPGFPGGAQNVAFVPGTSPNLPITVSSVHNGSNTVQFTSPPLNNQFFVPGNPNIQFNGFTIPLKAKLALKACDTFHIKLAIADGSDRFLNSGVFLEAKSFSSPTITIQAKPEFYSLGSDSNLYEGCGNVSLVFKRFGEINQKRTVFFTLGGSAQNGIDYSFIPDSVVFQPGQSSSQILFNIFDDGVLEGTENISIFIPPDTINCIIQQASFSQLEILDQPQVTITNTVINADCRTDSVLVSPSLITGVAPYKFLWNTGDTSDSFMYTITTDSVFLLTVTDACGKDTAFGSVGVTKVTTNLIAQTKNDSIFCTNDSIEIAPIIIQGSSLQNFIWSNGKTSSSIFVAPAADSTFYVTVTDFCDSANPHFDSITVFRVVPDFEIFTRPDSVSCNQQFVTIGPQIIKGSAKQTYLWNTGDTTPQITFTHFTDTVFYVTVTDVCDSLNPLTDSISVVNFNPPLLIKTDSATINCGGNLQLSPQILSGSAKQFYQWSTGDTTATIQITVQNDTTVLVTVTDACSLANPIVDTFTVLVLKQPLLISVANQTLSCNNNQLSATVQVTSGNTPLTFLWNNGHPGPTLTIPIFSDTTFFVTVTDGCGQTKTDTLEVTYTGKIPIISQTNDTTINCPGDSALLNVTAGGGSPPYQYIWSTGAGMQSTWVTPQQSTTYVIQIEDQCPGNYTYDTMQVNIASLQALQVLVNDTFVLCQGDSILIKPQTQGGLPPYKFSWFLNSTLVNNTDSLFISRINEPQNYQVLATDGCNNENGDTFTIEIQKPVPLEAVFPPDTFICQTDSFFILASINGGVKPYKHAWYFNNNFIGNDSSFYFNQQESGLVILEVFDRCSENTTGQWFLNVENCLTKAMNIFTPNGDGKNDFFIIPGIKTNELSNSALPTASIQIFNRWGQIVFKSNFYQNNWDAYGSPDGTYYYVVNLSNGKILNGSITVIR